MAPRFRHGLGTAGPPRPLQVGTPVTWVTKVSNAVGYRTSNGRFPKRENIIPHFEKLSHTWPLILEFVGPNSFPYGRIISVDARIRLLGYPTEEVMHPDWEEELQDSGSAQWRVFYGEEEQMVPT